MNISPGRGKLLQPSIQIKPGQASNESQPVSNSSVSSLLSSQTHIIGTHNSSVSPPNSPKNASEPSNTAFESRNIPKPNVLPAIFRKKEINNEKCGTIAESPLSSPNKVSSLSLQSVVAANLNSDNNCPNKNPDQLGELLPTSTSNTSLQSGPHVVTQKGDCQEKISTKSLYSDALQSNVLTGGVACKCQPVISFHDPQLDPRIQAYFTKKNVADLLYAQCHTIPAVIQGHDVCVMAPSKKGKSTAVITGLLQRILHHKDRMLQSGIPASKQLKCTYFYVCSTWRKAQICHDIFISMLSSCTGSNKSKHTASASSVRVCVTFAGQQENNTIIRLIEMSSALGCDIIFGTPCSLLRLVEGDERHSSCLSIYNTFGGLVLDDLDELCHVQGEDSAYLPEVQRIMLLRQQALVFLSHNAESLLESTISSSVDNNWINRKQLVVTCTRWTPQVKSFVKRHLNELSPAALVWQSPLEMALVADIQQRFGCGNGMRSEERAEQLAEMLATNPLGDSLGIVCVNDTLEPSHNNNQFETQDTVEQVHEALGRRFSNRSIHILQGHITWTHLKAMLDSLEKKKSSLLVLCDSVLSTSGIVELLPLRQWEKSGNWLAHWNLPMNMQLLGWRMLMLLKTVELNPLTKNVSGNTEDDKGSPSISYFLCDGKEMAWWKLELTETHRTFLEDLREYFSRCQIPNGLPQTLQDALVSTELQLVTSNANTGKTLAALCLNVKMFGKCHKSDCQERHRICHEADAPLTTQSSNVTSEGGEFYWPIEGEIEFRISKVLSPNRFFVYLLSHRIGNARYTYARLLPVLAMKISLHFMQQSHDVPLKKEVAQVGEIVAWRRRDNEANRSIVTFHRCEIIRVSSSKPLPLLSIRLLDIDGGEEQHSVQLKDLRQLPEELSLKHYPPLAVEVIVMNIRPVDREPDFTPEATEVVRKLLADSKELYATIVLSLRGTLWVDDFMRQQRLPGNSVKLTNRFLVREIVQHGVATRHLQHRKRLLELCVGEITVPLVNTLLPMSSNVRKTAVVDNQTPPASGSATSTADSSRAEEGGGSNFWSRHFTYPTEKEDSMAHPIPVLPWPTGMVTKCIVSHIVSPQEMYVCRESSWEEMWDMIEFLNKSSAFLRPYLVADEDLLNRDPFVAVAIDKTDREGEWYRGQIMQCAPCACRTPVAEDGATSDVLALHIYLVDFGETVCVTKSHVQLRQLPCELRQLPMQAQRCRLEQGFHWRNNIDSQYPAVITGHNTPSPHDLLPHLREFLNVQGSTLLTCLSHSLSPLDCISVKLSHSHHLTIFTTDTCHMDLGDYLICYGVAKCGVHFSMEALADFLFPGQSANNEEGNGTLTPMSVENLQTVDTINLMAHDLMITQDDPSQKLRLAKELHRLCVQMTERQLSSSGEDLQRAVWILVQLSKYLTAPDVLNYVYLSLHLFASYEKSPLEQMHSHFVKDQVFLSLLLCHWQYLALQVSTTHLDTATCYHEFYRIVTRFLWDITVNYFVVEALTQFLCLPHILKDVLSCIHGDLELSGYVLELVQRFIDYFPNEVQSLLPVIVSGFSAYDQSPHLLALLLSMTESLVRSLEHKEPLGDIFREFWSHCVRLVRRGILTSENELGDMLAKVLTRFWTGQHVDHTVLVGEEEELKSVVESIESVALRRWHLEMLSNASWQVKKPTPSNMTPALPAVPVDHVDNKESSSLIVPVPVPVSDVIFIVQPLASPPVLPANHMREPKLVKWSQTRDWLFLIVIPTDEELPAIVAGSLCPITVTEESLHFRLADWAFDLELWGKIASPSVLPSSWEQGGVAVKCGKVDIRVRLPKCTQGLWPTLWTDGWPRPNFVVVDMDRVHLAYDEEAMKQSPDGNEKVHFLPPVTRVRDLMLTAPADDLESWIARGCPTEPVVNGVASMDGSSSDEEDVFSFRGRNPADEGVTMNFGLI